MGALWCKQIDRLKTVIAEKTLLREMQERCGSGYLGSNWHPRDRKNWMSSLDPKKARINMIVWPGTHSSATNKIGIEMITRPFAQCQSLSVYQQLVCGADPGKENRVADALSRIPEPTVFAISTVQPDMVEALKGFYNLVEGKSLTTKLLRTGRFKQINGLVIEGNRVFVPEYNKALYGRSVPDFNPYIPGSSDTPSIDFSLQELGRLRVLLKNNLKRAQQRMTSLANAHRIDKTFSVGDMVYLRLKDYRQHTVSFRKSKKLAKRFYGPFKILERIGQIYQRKLSHFLSSFSLSLTHSKGSPPRARVLDIRVEETGKVCHGILSTYGVDVVIEDVKRFISETKSEIIILKIRTEAGRMDPPGLEKYVWEQLYELLIRQNDNVFEKTITEIILPRRVICVWKPHRLPKLKHKSPFWGSSYLRDNWIDTDLPATKFESNMKYLSQQLPVMARRYFYRVENTVTPQADNPVVCVKAVTNRIHGYGRLFIAQCFQRNCVNCLQIFSIHFIAEDFFDACVGLTQARLEGEA
ncbi:uncharacterized protein LOC143530638 [Bidens hawaiensis]|uniref:uncharacterized protein LOC143530638 n=1 Tax=Bidens hawaiensis TaxID=980011 RepID=UPI00404AAE2B